MSVKVPGMNQAKRLFERDFSDVIALVEGGTPEIYKKFGAELVVHAELSESIDQYVMVHLATPASVNERMYSKMVDEIYRVFCVLFVRLRDRNAFRFVAASMSPEAEAQLMRMEEVAGARQRVGIARRGVRGDRASHHRSPAATLTLGRQPIT